MTQTQHKAGPWHVSVSGNSMTVRHSSGTIARMAIAVQSTHAETGKANARLIAAAPELLEALQAAEELHQVGILNATVELVDRVVTLRRAAIAKATGA